LGLEARYGRAFRKVPRDATARVASAGRSRSAPLFRPRVFHPGACLVGAGNVRRTTPCLASCNEQRGGGCPYLKTNESTRPRLTSLTVRRSTERAPAASLTTYFELPTAVLDDAIRAAPQGAARRSLSAREAPADPAPAGPCGSRGRSSPGTTAPPSEHSAERASGHTVRSEATRTPAKAATSVGT
jgi:hypothetical protein